MGVRPRHSRHREETAPPAGSDNRDIWLARKPDASGSAPKERRRHPRAHHALACTLLSFLDRASAAHLNFLLHLQQTQLGTSNRKAALELYGVASAPLFPKFVSECAEGYHELRKRGTSHAGRASPLTWVRCMMRRLLGSNASRRCMVQRLSHSTRSPTRQTCSQANSGRSTKLQSSSSSASDSASSSPTR